MQTNEICGKGKTTRNARKAFTVAMSLGILAGGTPAFAANNLEQGIPAVHAQEIENLLREAANQMERPIPGMRTIMINANDPVARQFVARRLMGTSEDDLEHSANGLASLFVPGATNQDSTCWIIYDPNRGGHLWRNFIEPFVASQVRIGSTFLIAHEVAHCLDGAEQRARLSGNREWTRQQAQSFGIQADAWKRVSGNGSDVLVSDVTYLRYMPEIAKDRAQMQYRERLADAFAMLWIWHMGADPSAVEIVNRTRSVQSSWGSHSTSPVFPVIAQYADAAPDMELTTLWQMARGAQVSVGVDQRVASGDKAGPTSATKPLLLPESSGRSLNTVVTPTPIRFGSQAPTAQIANPDPQAIAKPTGVAQGEPVSFGAAQKFSQIKRFGQ